MNRLKKAVAECLVLAAFLAFFPNSALSITVKEEEEIAREFMKEVLRRFEIVDDPTIIDYVNSVGARVVATLPPQPFEYKFFVIKQDVYNAFATPAGNIFIYTGLIKRQLTHSRAARPKTPLNFFDCIFMRRINTAKADQPVRETIDSFHNIIVIFLNSLRTFPREAKNNTAVHSLFVHGRNNVARTDQL